MLQEDANKGTLARPDRGRLPLMAARVMGMLPTTPLEVTANAVMTSVLARHPGMQQRLGEHAGRCFAVDPIDCPFAFILEPRNDKPRLPAPVANGFVHGRKGVEFVA